MIRHWFYLIKYGYTLDDIYCRQNSKYHFNNKFNIDIQKLITCDENNIYITFYKDFWEYIHEIATVNNSHNIESTKKTRILELAAKYNNEKSDIIFQISIPKEKNNSYIRVDDKLFPYCYDIDLRKEKTVPTDEQVKEIIDFWESLQ